MLIGSECPTCVLCSETDNKIRKREREQECKNRLPLVASSNIGLAVL